jgi:hypothetical protein
MLCLNSAAMVMRATPMMVVAMIGGNPFGVIPTLPHTISRDERHLQIVIVPALVRAVWIRREGLVKADRQQLRRIWTAPRQIVAMEVLGRGGGWRRRIGKGLPMLAHVKAAKIRLCESYFVSVFTFLVRATVITGTGYFAHEYLLQMPEHAQNKER